MTGVGASLMALVFAATYPDRTSSLVMVDPFARARWAEDNPWGYRIDRLEGDLDRIRANWGTRSGTMGLLAPELLADRDLAQRFMRYERQSASPGMARAMIGWMYSVDVRHVLPTIRVPTLAHHQEGKADPDRARARRRGAGPGRTAHRARGVRELHVGR